ncbi:response regulator [bacterium]|nr:response regulator [bacterium]
MTKVKPLVLVADDESDLLDVLDEQLRAIGFETILANDGMDAWEKFQEFGPVMVITDIHMPRMNGITLLKQIKETDEEVIVIVITGYSHYQQLIQYVPNPPDAFLQKPFNMETLIKSIRLAYKNRE